MSKSNKPLVGIMGHEVTGATVPPASGVPSTYVRAVTLSGGLPLIIPSTPTRADMPRFLSRIDGLLIPGGVDVSPEAYGEMPHEKLGKVDPVLDRVELPLIREAFAQDVPILAICRGIQSLAVALGGNLYQDLQSQSQVGNHDIREHGRSFTAHEIRIDETSSLAAILGHTDVAVNTLHHQAVRDVPSELRIVAGSDDGVIEALEAPSKSFVIGVQCHPEELLDTPGSPFPRLFEAFIQACRLRMAGVKA